MKWDAEDYNRNSLAQQAWARELIAKLRLEGDESVLDVGCGDGKITAEIATLVPEGRAVGVDNSPEMIKFASRKFGASIANLRFLVRDARALDFEAEFDVVFSNAALHWVIEHEPVLAGIARALKPGGRILLQMGGRGNAADIIALMDELAGDIRWGSYFRKTVNAYGFYGPEEYAGWLADAGLRPLRLELMAKDMTHSGKEGLAAWLRTVWLPYTQRVPEDLRDEFIEDIVERYVRAHPLDNDGLVHVPMSRLEVEATKDNV